MISEKKKYIVNVTKKYTDAGMLHRTACTPQVTQAVSSKQAVSNIRHRMGRPLHPFTNSSDEMCVWEFSAELMDC